MSAGNGAAGRSAKRPLKVGLFFPHAQVGPDGRKPQWESILALAQTAEAVGFDSLWFPDHFLYPRGDLGLNPDGTPRGEREAASGFWDCWTLMAGLAAAVPRVELGTLVSCTGYRNPGVLAKIVDTIEEISGGRVIFGIGGGDSGYEHNALGLSYDNRIGRFEEAMTIIHHYFHEGIADLDGTHYSAHELERRPAGPRPNGPPIMIGTLGTGKRMMRLTAQYADLWNGWIISRSRPDRIPPLREAIDAACVEHGRDPATLGRTLTVGASVLGRAMPGMEVVTGEPEAMAEIFRAFANEGISHVQIWLTPTSRAGVEAFAPVLELLDKG
jgi:alkanesulfonate monooxygenase SsuD/methylene tetrahydromethanopterin reductase-like flavin-dependent oxidoreductase (luciferase family)